MYTDGERLYASRLTYAMRKTGQWFAAVLDNTDEPILAGPVAILGLPGILVVEYSVAKSTANLKPVPEHELQGLAKKVMSQH